MREKNEPSKINENKLKTANGGVGRTAPREGWIRGYNGDRQPKPVCGALSNLHYYVWEGG